MNKINKYLLMSMVAGVSFTSCNDLDTHPFGDVITEDQRTEVIGNNPEKLQATIAAMYAAINAWESASANMFDFGYPGVMIQMDSRTADFLTVYPDQYGWFSSCVAWQDNSASSAYGICRWRVPYNSIYTANQVINIVASLDPEKADNTYRFYRAQALGTRAFCYWVLAQLFQFNYVGHEQSPCVPLITEENQADIAINGAPRATVAEIYNQIIADLTEGIELTNGNPIARDDKRYIDNNVLKALRARAYLCMQKYSEAAADAQAVINSGRFSALNAQQASVPGFNELSAANWIWGINMDETDVHGLYTFSGMMGSYTYGYAYAGMWKIINSNLFARISSNDVRRTWWIDEDGNSNAVNYTNASSDAVAYLEGIGAPTYAVTKFAPYQNTLQQSNNAADIPLIRIEEMYLILAEAQGLGGDIASGKATLEKFVNDFRWTGRVPYACTASSPEDFLDEVWFQRRVELWGEGMSYFDVLRLNKDVDRRNSNWETSSNRVTQYAYYVPAGSAVMLSQIPQSELEGNPALTSADQNPTGQAGI
ncbi:MAG: RagB/SusD family nutrient uptake outer membrane protein [Muribaculaceae bacterium]|jgi:hypothetical protein|nr:RagB/SusD family nutrient uptake outer membrane protein [Muribaculaceae bacterium]